MCYHWRKVHVNRRFLTYRIWQTDRFFFFFCRIHFPRMLHTLTWRICASVECELGSLLSLRLAKVNAIKRGAPSTLLSRWRISFLARWRAILGTENGRRAYLRIHMVPTTTTTTTTVCFVTHKTIFTATLQTPLRRVFFHAEVAIASPDAHLEHKYKRKADTRDDYAQQRTAGFSRQSRILCEASAKIGHVRETSL